MHATPSRTFTVTLIDEGAIPIDFDQRSFFGKARPPVVVEINGHSYRSTIAIMGGVTFVPLRRSNREAAGVSAGQSFEVTLTLDTAPRTVEVSADFAKALADAGVRSAWDGLSYSNRREQVEAIESAKRAETRARRIAAAIAALSA